MASFQLGRSVRVLVASALLASVAGVAIAQEQPVSGGTIRFATVGEPPSYDCQSFTSITQFQYLAPHYSTLLAIDPSNFPEGVG